MNVRSLERSGASSLTRRNYKNDYVVWSSTIANHLVGVHRLGLMFKIGCEVVCFGCFTDAPLTRAFLFFKFHD